MLEIALSRSECDRAIAIGTRRQATNAAAKVSNQRYSSQSDESIHIQGVVGEMAVLKGLGIDSACLDDTRPCSGKTDRHDVVLPTGESIDVKTVWQRSLPNAVMQSNVWKYRNHATLYVMAAIMDNDINAAHGVTVRILGGLPASTFLMPENLRKTQYGWMYRAERGLLKMHALLPAYLGADH